jgi:hypothetical protein
MGLLDKLTKDGSTLSSLDGSTPKSYDGASQYQQDLKVSQLDLDGKDPAKYDQATAYQKGLALSKLEYRFLASFVEFFISLGSAIIMFCYKY